MSGKHTALLDFLRGYYVMHGIPATLREIIEAGHCNSLSMASLQLERLSADGDLNAYQRGGKTTYIPAGYTIVKAAP